MTSLAVGKVKTPRVPGHDLTCCGEGEDTPRAAGMTSLAVGKVKTPRVPVKK